MALAACCVLAVVALVPGGARPVSTGPQPGMAGVPPGQTLAAEATCNSCHDSYALNPDASGKLELDGLPERWAPGAHYTLVFSISHPDAALLRWGFQLTAVWSGSLEKAGHFVVTDAANTQKVEGPLSEREYMEHTYPGTGIGVRGGHRWTFDWIAPEAREGEIAFYGAGVASNVDGSKNGDRVFSPTPSPLEVVAPPAPAAE